MNLYTLTTSQDNCNNFLASGELVEKKSKFISYVYRISNEEEANKYIEDIKKNNKSARHVVYIYNYLKNNIVNFSFSDDGEPRGTGTKAIYELLVKENITNICIIIVRYFGGILLGAGPLSRAYLNSARNAIIKCNKKELYKYIEMEYIISYQKYQQIKSKLDNYMKKEDIKEVDLKFNEKVTISFKVKSDIVSKVNSIFL